MLITIFKLIGYIYFVIVILKMLGKIGNVTDIEKKELSERERRQRAEVERQNRIFNDRIRKIGVDANALHCQVQEQQIEKRREEEWEKSFINQICKDNELASVLATREKQERRKFEEDINKYRTEYQHREDTREYDLNDPNALKKQQPARSSDSREIGLPTGQKFAGEDLRKEERDKVMAEQRSAWLEQQIKEKYAHEAEKMAAEYAYKQREIARDERSLQLEIVDRNCRRQLEAANLRFNQMLAEQNSHKKTNDYQNETQDNIAEVYNCLTSDLMTENPHSAKSAFGPHRLIPYMYKGMSNEEKQAIRVSQMNQIAEQKVEKVKRDAERKRAIEWDNSFKNFTQSITLQDCESQQMRRAAALQMKQENLRLSMEQKEKQMYLDKIVYTNVPTEEYFSKFNTTSR